MYLMNSVNLYIIVSIIFVFALWAIFGHICDENIEGFDTGKLCSSCTDNTYNRCLRCFNCGYCIDKYGYGMCMAGDINGPYNYERCRKWYYGDPYLVMKNRNCNYKHSYGPKSSNRRIGVYPC